MCLVIHQVQLAGCSVTDGNLESEFAPSLSIESLQKTILSLVNKCEVLEKRVIVNKQCIFTKHKNPLDWVIYQNIIPNFTFSLISSHINVLPLDMEFMLKYPIRNTICEILTREIGIWGETGTGIRGFMYPLMAFPYKKNSVFVYINDTDVTLNTLNSRELARSKAVNAKVDLNNPYISNFKKDESNAQWRELTDVDILKVCSNIQMKLMDRLDEKYDTDTENTQLEESIYQRTIIKLMSMKFSPSYLKPIFYESISKLID
jgi:hypothetical protein